MTASAGTTIPPGSEWRKRPASWKLQWSGHPQAFETIPSTHRVMNVDREYLTRTLATLVKTNSINPAFSDGKHDEMEIAGIVADALGALGLEVEHHDAAPGRRSVVGRLRGTGGGKSLMLYAHMD